MIDSGRQMVDGGAMGGSDPHGSQPIRRRGPEPSAARLAAVLVHGRGGSPEDMLALADEFRTRDVAYLAIQAAGGAWYPHSFLAPLDDNEPGLSSGLNAIDRAIAELNREGLTTDRIGLLGFSQGACLALEYAARHARPYAG